MAIRGFLLFAGAVALVVVMVGVTPTDAVSTLELAASKQRRPPQPQPPFPGSRAPRKRAGSTGGPAGGGAAGAAGTAGTANNWKTSGGSKASKDRMQQKRAADIKKGKYATTSDGQKITQSQVKSKLERKDGKKLGRLDGLGAAVHARSPMGKGGRDIRNVYNADHLKAPEKSVGSMIKNPLARHPIGAHRVSQAMNPDYVGPNGQK